MLYINNVVQGFIAVLLCYSCYTDIRYRQIKNISTAFILLFSLMLGVSWGGVNFIIPFIFLIFGFFLTAIGIIGAGDIKLIFALLLGIPAEQVGRFFLLMCTPGIPVALFTLFIAVCILKKKENTVPFGVAVACGYILLTGEGYV